MAAIRTGNSAAVARRPMKAATTSTARLTSRTESGIRVDTPAGARTAFLSEATSIGKDNMDMVRLSVPGTLLYRDVVLRVVASVCRLVRCHPMTEQEASHRGRVADFDDQVVSAVGEAFNNVALHSYGDGAIGLADLELEYEGELLNIRLFDTGRGFNLSAQVAPDLASLPESHMGLHIMQSCMDEVSYSVGRPPAPNVLTLTKRCLLPASPE